MASYSSVTRVACAASRGMHASTVRYCIHILYVSVYYISIIVHVIYTIYFPYVCISPYTSVSPVHLNSPIRPYAPHMSVHSPYVHMHPYVHTTPYVYTPHTSIWPLSICTLSSPYPHMSEHPYLCISCITVGLLYS